MALLNACWFVAGSSGLSDFSDGTAQQGFQNLNDAGAVDGDLYSYRAESLDRTEWENGRGAYASAGGGTLARTTIYESSNAGAKVNFTSPPLVNQTALAVDLSSTSGGSSVASDLFLHSHLGGL